MKPLSARTRRAYFFTLVCIFVAAILPLALYANGWRFSMAEGLLRTGGIYLHVSLTGVTAYVDGEAAETSSLLQRNIFVQNLSPEEHEFSVYKEGFRPWSKTLPVRSQKVTEAHPLLVPETLERIAIPEFLPVATTTDAVTVPAPVKNPEYVAATLLFKEELVVQTATSTDPVKRPFEKTKGKLTVYPEGKTVVASWQGVLENAPFYFCATGSCVATTTVTFSDRVSYVDFYPGEQDFILVALPDGVYAAELDTRSSVMVTPLVEAKNIEFRVDTSDTILLKEGDSFSTLLLQ